jgi:CheY-like chemotaxis protein
MITEPKKRDVALVVDDSPETLRLLTDALDGAGMTVMVALDGASALRIIEQVTPDVILLDAVMPEMDGFDLAQAVRANPRNAHIPIVGLSSSCNAHIRECSARVGLSDVVAKFDRQGLIAALQQQHEPLQQTLKCA